MNSKLNKKMKYLLFICVTFGFLLQALSIPHGGNSGGGGTGVRISATSNLVFWDLYLANPNLQDSEAGDIIQLPIGSESAVIDYRGFKSFEFLRRRMMLWKDKAPLAAAVIGSQGFLTPRRPKQNSELSLSLSLIATRLFLRHLVEISVPANLATTAKIAFPIAYINEPMSNNILLNVTNWNQLGLKSQAATLLHERIRYLQSYFVITNDEMQKMVAQIILDDPETTTINDGIFARTNMMRTPPSLIPVFELRVGFNETDRAECLKVESTCDYTHVAQRLSAVSDLDLQEAIRNYRRYVGSDRYWFNTHFSAEKTVNLIRERESELLQETDPGGMALQSRGYLNPRVSSTFDYLMQSAYCPQVLRDHVNWELSSQGFMSRENLHCIAGQLFGRGTLRFVNSNRPENFVLEIDASIYSSQGQFQLRFFEGSSGVLRLSFEITSITPTQVKPGEITQVALRGPMNQTLELQFLQAARSLKIFGREFTTSGYTGPSRRILIGTIALSEQQLQLVSSMRWSVEVNSSAISEIRVRK